MHLPQRIEDVKQLEDMLSAPPDWLVQRLAKVPGDVIVLGAGGKMGPTLARMARRAAEAAGAQRRVIAVARFSDPAVRERLEAWGLETITCDLLDGAALARLPDAPNVIYMAGMKFGSSGNEPLTWTMNTLLPADICRSFPHSRIAAFSTGNVYGLVPVAGASQLVGVQGNGSRETDAPRPEGEYAMSCLGRERAFQYYSQTCGTPVALLRLNYAVEMRYGVLVDLAQKVWSGLPIDLGMGHVNVIWQGDANAMAIAALDRAASPAVAVNIAGPERLSVRAVCEQFGRLMQREPRFTGVEAETALLSDGRLGYELLGRPTVTADQMIRCIADWVIRGGPTLNKPTHFESRDGKF